jgi:anti-sigma-K factor RskA
MIVLTVRLKAGIPDGSAVSLTQSAIRQPGVTGTRWTPCTDLYVAVQSSAAAGPVEQWLREQPGVASVAESAASAVGKVHWECKT